MADISPNMDSEAASSALLKLCRKCGETKRASEFYVRTKTKKGRTYSFVANPCKVCKDGERRAYLATEQGAANQRRLAQARTLHDRQAESRRKAERKGKAYRTREEIEATKAQRLREKHERSQARLASMLPKLSTEERRIAAAERFRLRYRTDPEFNLRQKARAALKRTRQGVKIGKVVRSAMVRDGAAPSVEGFLGYTMADLRIHLERQFTKGMTWERFCNGEIHIDHRRPMTSFNLDDPDELKAAWTLTNLQPLWAADNLAKAARVTVLL